MRAIVYFVSQAARLARTVVSWTVAIIITLVLNNWLGVGRTMALCLGLILLPLLGRWLYAKTPAGRREREMANMLAHLESQWGRLQQVDREIAQLDDEIGRGTIAGR